MTREEQIRFCEKCINRKMDIQNGIICSLTGEKATFSETCPDYVLDEEYEKNQLEKNIQLLPHEIDKLRTEQNLVFGSIASIIVGIFGAILWAGITIATNFQIGFMAIAIGASVGYTMRIFGKGIDQIFGYLGAVIAVLSCVLGNFFTIIGYVANTFEVGYLETFLSIDYNIIPSAMAESFSIMDLLFYGIAGLEGYKFAFIEIKKDDL